MNHNKDRMEGGTSGIEAIENGNPGAGAGDGQSELKLMHLSAYARFILDHKLTEMAREQLKLVKQMQVPVFSYFSALSDEELLARGIASLQKLLTALSEGRASGYIASSVKEWVKGKLPDISRNQIKIEDISSISFIRRKAFRDFLSSFTTDLESMRCIMEDIDAFIAALDTASVNNLVSIQQELYEQAQEIAHIGNWDWDLLKDSITWSKELFRIYGLQSAEKAPKGLASYNHPEDAPKVDAEMRRSLETKEPHDFCYRITSADGKEKHLHAIGQVMTDVAGSAVRMFGTLQDVTAEKRAERELKDQARALAKSEERYHKMIEVVEDYAVILLDREGVIESWNNGAQKIKGYAPEEIIGKHFRVFYTPEDQTALLPESLIGEALQSGKAAHEGWRLRKDGSKFWGSVLITALHGTEQEIIGFSKITRDLTQKRMSEELIEQNMKELETNYAKLEQQNKELESFSYVASHDLQEPLRKIRMWSDKLAAGAVTGEELGSGLQRIQDASIRMQALIKDLLDYSQIGIGAAGDETTDLNSALQGVIAEMSELLHEKNAVVKAGMLPAVKGARLHFHQLFANIISNSVKYCKEGTDAVINISSSVTEEEQADGSAPILVNLIRVSDNGIGFKQEHAEKIFELFQRLHDKHKYTGTGIGLAICKRIVQGYDGKIWAISSPGEGAVFNVQLPIN